MTVNAALHFAAVEFNRREILLLLSHVTELSRTQLLINGCQELTPAEETAFKGCLVKRRTGMPIQYIIGHWPFMGLEIKVDSRVLIPRPETELLAEAVLKHIRRHESLNKEEPSKQKTLRVLDLCTGSGCIAIALAYCTNAEITAADISIEALTLAQENAVVHQVRDRIKFVESDLFNNLAGPGETYNAYDIIVTNPPYIPSGDILKLNKDVRDFEPVLALDGGTDGLVPYRRLIPESLDFLCPNGALFMEIGPSAAAALMRQAGYTGVTVQCDFSGIDRVVYGIKREEAYHV